MKKIAVAASALLALTACGGEMKSGQAEMDRINTEYWSVIDSDMQKGACKEFNKDKTQWIDKAEDYWGFNPITFFEFMDENC